MSNLFFGVFSTLLLTRALSEITLGVWAQFLLITAVIEILRQGLVRNAIITFSKHCTHDELRLLLGAALVLNIMLALFSSIMLVVCYVSGIDNFLHSPGLGKMLLYYIPANLLYIFITLYEWRVVIDNNFKKIFSVVFLRQSVSGLLIFCLFIHLLPATTNMLVIIYSCGIAVASVFVILKMDWEEILLPKDSSIYKRLFNYGKFSLGTNIALPIFKMTDHVITSVLYSAALVAPLSICIRLTNIAEIPSQVLSEIVFPKSAALYAKGEKKSLSIVYERAVSYGLVLVFPGVLFSLIFPEFLLWLVAGSKYTSYTHLLRISMLVCLLMPFLRQFGTITDASNKPYINMRMMFTLAAINIPSCWFFIHHFGLVGAAYGVLISHIVIFIINYFVLRKLYEISLAKIFWMIPQVIKELWQLIISKLPVIRKAV